MPILLTLGFPCAQLRETGTSWAQRQLLLSQRSKINQELCFWRTCFSSLIISKIQMTVCTVHIVDWVHICVYYTDFTLAKRKYKKVTGSLRYSPPGLHIPFLLALDSLPLKLQHCKTACRCFYLFFPPAFQNEDILSMQWPRFFVCNFRYFTTGVASLHSIEILCELMPSGGPSYVLALFGFSWDSCMLKWLSLGDQMVWTQATHYG